MNLIPGLPFSVRSRPLSGRPLPLDEGLHRKPVLGSTFQVLLGSPLKMLRLAHRANWLNNPNHESPQTLEQRLRAWSLAGVPLKYCRSNLPVSGRGS